MKALQMRWDAGFASAYQRLTAVLDIAHTDTMLEWMSLVVKGNLANEPVPDFGMQAVGGLLEMVARTNWAVYFGTERHSFSWL